MVQFLLRWVSSAVAFYITVVLGKMLHLHIWLAPGPKGILAAFIGAAVLGIVNAIIRPILQVLTLPITCMTFGLFSFVINAFTFWLVGFFVPGFNVTGFLASLFGSVVITIIGGLLHMVMSPFSGRDDRDDRQE